MMIKKFNKKIIIYISTIMLGASLLIGFFYIVNIHHNKYGNYKIEFTIDSKSEYPGTPERDSYNLSFISHQSNLGDFFKTISYKRNNEKINDKPVVKNIFFVYSSDESSGGGLYIWDVSQNNNDKFPKDFIIASLEGRSENNVCGLPNYPKQWWETYLWSNKNTLNTTEIPNSISPLTNSFSKHNLLPNCINHFGLKLRNVK